jgi:dihydropteroate synthase
MGILNVTPDSFSDGGAYTETSAAVRRAEQMIAEGADIVDIGAESTRPGTAPLPLQQELDRLVPVVEALANCGKPLSIDTYKPDVMRATLSAGADMINDITGFRSDDAILAVKNSPCGLCVMHMQGTPRTMQVSPEYDDVTGEVTLFLSGQASRLRNEGIAHSRICVDPGFGFGKTQEHNLTLMRNMGRMREALPFPILVGLSRKSMIGQITDKPVSSRLAGSLGAALSAAAHGAFIIRVHDVGETVDALRVWIQTR